MKMIILVTMEQNNQNHLDEYIRSIEREVKAALKCFELMYPSYDSIVNVDYIHDIREITINR